MRTTFLSLFAAGAVACAGCEDMQLDPEGDSGAPTVVMPEGTDSTPPPADPTAGEGATPSDATRGATDDPGVSAPGDEPIDPTNTGRNERDAVENPPPLPTDQDAAGAGFEVTTEIRQRITNTDGMSINARNVKIVTEGTRVTLRGPVEDDAEKQSIDRIAREVAGDRYTVVNMLEVESNVR